MIKPVAVVSSNHSATRKWLRATKDIAHENVAQKVLTARDGLVYFIVSNDSDVYAYEFSDCITAPDFVSLEALCRQRVR